MSSVDWQKIEQQLDQAIDALNHETAPPTFADEQPEYLELLDAVRLVRRLRTQADPEPAFVDQLASRLAGEQGIANAELTRYRQVPASANGWRGMPRPRQVLPSRAVPLLLNNVGAGVVAGILAGLIAGGIWGRIAMRISAELYMREHPNASATTESSGRLVGTFSLDGTVSLLIEGMVAGVLGGLLYVSIRRWLPADGVWRGLVFGLVALMIAGTTTIDANNEDFARLGSAWLNVTMFGLIFLLFGAIAGPLADRLSRRRRPSIPIQVAGVFGVICSGMLVIGVLATTASSLAGQLTNSFSPVQVITMALLILAVLVLPALSVLGWLAEQSSRARAEHSSHITLLARAALLTALTCGTILLVRAGILIVT